MRIFLISLLFVPFILALGVQNEERIVQIFHKRGENGQETIQKLFSLGITGIELPRKTSPFIEAYISSAELPILHSNGFTFKEISHETQEIHKQLKRRTQGISTFPPHSHLNILRISSSEFIILVMYLALPHTPHTP